MANQLEQVKQIEKAIDGLISKLKDVNTQIVAISKSTREFTQGFDNVKTPNGLNDKLKETNDNTEKLTQLQKEQNKIERQLASTIAKKVLVQSDTNKQLTKEREELKILRREQRNQVKAVSEIAGAYTKLSATNNILIKRYQDLAVRQAKGIQLTEKEERRLTKLGNAIQKNNDILKKTDAEVGRFQRNVGNYASGFDGLGNAINQLTREAPAFANSLQTGFLAISNNLPILFDQLTAITEQNKILRAEGKPTESVFKRLGGAIFSFQTALSLGVTLLTLYGKELVNLVQRSIDGGAKVRDLADNQKILNEAYKEGAKSASQEIAQLQLLLAVASDKTKSDETRKKAVDKLIDSSGGLIKEQDRLNILNGEAVEIENKLVKAILNRAIVQQLQEKISEDVNKLLDKKLELQELEIQKSKLLEEGLKNLKDANIDLTEEESKGLNQKEKLLASLDKLSKANKRDLQLQGEGFVKQQEANKLGDKANKLNQETTVIQNNINALIKEALKLTDDYTLGLDDNTNSTKSNNKELRDRAKILFDINKITEDNLVLFEAFKKTTDFENKGIEPLKIDQKSIDEFQEKLAQIKFFELLDDEVKNNIKDSLDDLSNIISDFTGANGQKFADFFDKVFIKGGKSFQDLADIGTSSLDILGESANIYFSNKIAQYEADIEANNQYYDALLENENITDEERERLERDRRSKEKNIREAQRKEQIKAAKIQKALAIAEIAINLAKTITNINAAAAAQDAITPFAFGATGAAYRAINIPQAIGLAAAQTAVVLASPVPQFKDGHLSGTYEGLAIVNDAYGSNYQEVIQRKDGTLEMYKGRNQMINMERGDKVFKAGTHGAEDYLKGFSDKELIQDVNKHSMLATLQHQNYMITKLENKKVIDNDKINTDRIIKAIKSQKTKFNLNQNINIAEDLDFLDRLNF